MAKDKKFLEPCFKFMFPPILGLYDVGDGTIYVFGEQNEDDLVDVLNHEILHFVVQKIAGNQACLDLDNVPSNILRI